MTIKTLNVALEWPIGGTVVYGDRKPKGVIVDTRRVGTAGAEALITWKDVLLPQTNWVNVQLLRVIDRPYVVTPQDVAHTPVYWS